MDLQTAASRLGVHYQTAYRWVREGSLVAIKRGSSYEISEDDLEAFRRRREAPVPPPERAQVRSWAHHVERLLTNLLAGDELGARASVDRLHQGAIEPLELCENLVAPALHRVGILWEQGEVSVAVEHRASAICERVLARLTQHPRGRPRGVAVVATPVGEEHGIPASMAALALRSDRWQVHHLGTQVPDDDLIDLVRTVHADLLVLSTTNPMSAGAATALRERATRETGAAVLVGRPGETLHELLDAARALNGGDVRTSRE